MRESPSVPRSTVAITRPDAPQARPTFNPWDGDERATAGSSTADSAGIASNRAVVSAEVTRWLDEDHGGIAQCLSVVVVRRLFAAGLDLQDALGIMSDQRAADKIYHAIGEIDQAIKDIRDTIFDRN